MYVYQVELHEVSEQIQWMAYDVLYFVGWVVEEVIHVIQVSMVLLLFELER